MVAQSKLAANRAYRTCLRHIGSRGPLRVLALCLCLSAAGLLLVSCSSAPTDVRTVVPADAQVYLETNDLGKALRAVAENDAFRNAAATVPDISAVDGVRLAVAVTGFKREEQQVADEKVVGTVIPQFVAVAETNAWNYQAVRITENKIGEFINEVYGGGVELETFPRHDGKYFIWTAQDGRKAYGLVIDSLIFFGNDESAIERCIAVRRGEADPISKNGKLPSGDLLASGYVGTDGVAQIANIATLQLAVGAGEEEEVRGFIARVLPEIIRNSVKEVTWTAVRTDAGIVDKHQLTLDPEVAKVFAETMVPAGTGQSGLAAYLPANAVSTTRYDLKDPRIAWRSVILSVQKLSDPVSGQLIAAFSDSLFEPYAVDNSDSFFEAVGPEILTATFDAEGERSVAIARFKDAAKLKAAAAKEIEFAKPPEKIFDAEIWRSADGTQAAALRGDIVIIGDAEGVLECLKAGSSGQPGTGSLPPNDRSASLTVDKDAEGVSSVVAAMSGLKEGIQPPPSVSKTQTRFTPTGVEREVTSEFGLIGSIIEQFAAER